MADKKITELQLRDNVSDDVNFPSDDGIQSYRVTAAQIKTYVLSALSIATGMLQDLAVTTAKLAAGAVTDAKTNFTPPTYQRFTSGSGTYNTPAGCKRIKIQIIGGGGGGGGSWQASTSGANGTDGGASTFGANITAGGGVKGSGATSGGVGNPGDGGTPTLGGGLVGLMVGGNCGLSSSNIQPSSYVEGGYGGPGPFGGRGSSYFGKAVQANSGAGGNGGQQGGANGYVGGGAGGGSFIEVEIASPASSYSYAVGAGGSGGAAGGGTGTNPGSSGAAGQIVVTEYYQ